MSAKRRTLPTPRGVADNWARPRAEIAARAIAYWREAYARDEIDLEQFERCIASPLAMTLSDAPPYTRITEAANS
jgi:hypothetical protein